MCIEPGNFSISDDESEVQTAQPNFQVENTPKDPFSQIAKPTRGNKERRYARAFQGSKNMKAKELGIYVTVRKRSREKRVEAIDEMEDA